MANNQFNFDAYNSMIKTAPTGLKLHLGVQLIKDVVSSLEYFDNPLEAEIRPVYLELKEFHVKYKESAKAAAAKKTNESERSASIDNSTVPQIGVADMQAMFTMFKAMMSAQKNGNEIVAHNASTSIKEIQDGVLHTVGDAVTQ